jgi:hypothetical protein
MEHPADSIQNSETTREGVISVPCASTHPIIDTVPRLTHTDLDSSDSSPSKDETGDITESDSDNEARLEEVLNSSENNAILESLKLEMSPLKPLHNDELVQILEKHTDSEDEFPLFPNQISNTDIIDEERLLTPEKRKHKDPITEGEGSISRRTRSSGRFDDPVSPISQRLSLYSQVPSKIPMPVSSIGVRRSKRLESILSDPHYRPRCEPKQVDIPLKSIIKSKKQSLNLIVEAQSGQLHEATRYATEINSLNGEGVMIPLTTGELVRVPITGTRKSTKNAKVALVRGYPSTTRSRGKDGKTIGFYSQTQYRKYCVSPSKVVKTTPSPKAKKLRWASELEW